MEIAGRMQTEIISTHKIAILLASYNGEKYISDQLNSLLRQTFQDYTCYIHDDGSSDQTLEIIKNIISEYPDKFCLIPGKSCGSAKENFRYLLQRVDAEFYMFCDQDDIWDENKIEKSLTELSKLDQSKPACVYTDLQVVDEELQVIDKSFFHYTGLDPYKNTYKLLIVDNVCAGCTMMFNRALRNRMIDLHSKSIPVHDHEAAIIAALFGHLEYMDQRTILYRQHKKNVLGAIEKGSMIKKGLDAVYGIKRYLQKKKEYLDRSANIAGELLQLEGLDSEKKAFLKEFSLIRKKNKIRRMKFYYFHNLFSQGKNKIWQLWRLLGS